MKQQHQGRGSEPRTKNSSIRSHQSHVTAPQSFASRYIAEDWDHCTADEKARHVFMYALVVVCCFGPLALIAINS